MTAPQLPPPLRGRFPLPLPNGWFQVAWADEVPPGRVKRLRYFGRELVAFRPEAGGPARVLDAHCPHLGAHLGVGGTVVGDRLRCPFHAWEFDGEGRCVRVPYARKIPPRARVGGWTALERNGAVYVHFHKEGAPPTWEPPEVAEADSDAWTAPVRREWLVASCAQEMAENTVDPAHFKYVHRTAELPRAEARAEGHVFRVAMDYPIRMGEAVQHGAIDIRCYGYGVGVTRFSGIVDTTVLVAGTPVDGEHLHHRLAFMVKKLDSPEATAGLGRAFVDEISRQFEEDRPIWEHKVHWQRPVLCDGDGPVGLLRRWGRQFH